MDDESGDDLEAKMLGEEIFDVERRTPSDVSRISHEEWHKTTWK